MPLWDDMVTMDGRRKGRGFFEVEVRMGMGMRGNGNSRGNVITMGILWELLGLLMGMVSADGSSQSFGGLTAQIGWFGLRVGGHPALSLHSSNEPGELSQ